MMHLNRLNTLGGPLAHPCDRSEAGHQRKNIKKQIDDAQQRLDALEKA